MKSAYVKPTMMFEIFRANESIAACWKNDIGAGASFYTNVCTLGDSNFDIESDFYSALDHLTGDVTAKVKTWNGSPAVSQLTPVQDSGPEHLHKFEYSLYPLNISWTYIDDVGTANLYTDGKGNYYSLYDAATDLHPNASN